MPKTLVSRVLALSVCVAAILSLSVTALGAGVYGDVLPEDGFPDAIAYVSERGYMNGYPDGSFRPDGDVTLRQFATVLGRVFPAESGGDALRWLVTRTYIRPGPVPESALDGPVDPVTAMGIAGRAFGVLPTQGESITYPAYSDGDACAYMRNAGMELGVFDIRLDEVLSGDRLSRGGLAYIVYRLSRYGESRPACYGWGYTDVSCVGPYGYLVDDAWDDILILPWHVVKHFHDAGYRIVCGEAGVSRFSSDGLSVIGVFSPADKAIFVQQVDGVIHAMGHYVSSFMVGRSEAEAVFPRERTAAAELISPNAGRDPTEFFAECFEYYIRAKNANNYASMATMRERMPEIWAFISNMDVLGWQAAGKYVPAETVGSGVFPTDSVTYSVYRRGV